MEYISTWCGAYRRFQFAADRPTLGSIRKKDGHEMKKLRHFRKTTTADQRVVYRFEPSKVMRAAGYRNETLGEDHIAGIA
jgi:hypothetical protein